MVWILIFWVQFKIGCDLFQSGQQLLLFISQFRRVRGMKSLPKSKQFGFLILSRTKCIYVSYFWVRSEIGWGNCLLMSEVGYFFRGLATHPHSSRFSKSIPSLGSIGAVVINYIRLFSLVSRNSLSSIVRMSSKGASSYFQESVILDDSFTPRT